MRVSDKLRFIVDASAFEASLKLRSAPRYMKGMLEKGHAVTVGDRSYVMVAKTTAEQEEMIGLRKFLKVACKGLQ